MIKKITNKKKKRIYENELDNTCFQHDIAYGNFKDLNWRTTPDKVLGDKAFNIAKIQHMIEINMDLLQWLKNFLIKTSGGIVKNETISDKEPVEEWHKPITRKFNKRKVHSPFIDNIWGANLVNMQLICKFNKRFELLLCIIDIYSKYAWVVPLKH